ncbi:MAG TPA: hypothetical protein VIM73_04050, partial [Polyangiaceae bacterium]
MSDDRRLRRLRSSAARASRRLRYRVGLARLAMWLPLPLGAACAALAAVKVFRLGESVQHSLGYGIGALASAALAYVIHGFLKRPARWAGALALDEHHRLDDRVTNALELLEGPDRQRTEFEQAAVEDGLGVASRLDARRAVPVALPPELGISVLLLGLLGG